MHLRWTSGFPEALEQQLGRLGRDIQGKQDLRQSLDLVLVALTNLGPSAAGQADHAIAHLCRLDWTIPAEIELLNLTPGLEYLFLFHGNGRLREAALNKIDGPIPSSFWFSLIAHRLNDWAEPVRSAAAKCAQRSFPVTSPAVIADAAMFLLERKRLWQRWNAEGTILDDAFARPDTTERLARLIRIGTHGRLGQVLAQSLRREGMEQFLLDLAENAVRPNVRALALRTLLRSRAIWFVHYGREWINKSLGLSRQAPILAERKFQRLVPIERLITIGARDKSSVVRKVVANALIEYRDTLQLPAPVIEQLALDRNRSVREKIAFFRRATAEGSKPN